MYGPMAGVTRFINSVEICRKHSSDNEMLGPRINTLKFHCLCFNADISTKLHFLLNVLQGSITCRDNKYAIF